MNDLEKIQAKGHKIDPEELAAAARELRESENTEYRDELELQVAEILGYKEGLKIGMEQGRYEMQQKYQEMMETAGYADGLKGKMARLEWHKLNRHIFLFSFLGTLLALFLWTMLSYVDQLPALFKWL